MKKEIENIDNYENSLPAKDDILMNEDELLSGLLQAASFKEDKNNQRKIQIKRNGGPALFEFYVRPISEEELQECRKKCTKKVPDPRGRQFPKIESDIDYVKLRSYKILMATVDKSNGKIWDNNSLKEKLGVLTAIDVIDTVLMGGEKDRICDIIDEISGYGSSNNVTDEEIAKN